MNTENTSDKNENGEIKDERIQRNRELMYRSPDGVWGDCLVYQSKKTSMYIILTLINL